MLFNTIFSDCSEGYPEVDLKGMRMGYPTNFWQDLGEEVCALHTSESVMKGRAKLSYCFSGMCCLYLSLQGVS